MELLADENQHPIVVARLRAMGYDVEFIRESTPGAKDGEILNRPDIGRKIFLTYDRDFGELIFNRSSPVPLTLIYTRLNRLDPSNIADRLIAVLDTGVPAGHIVTIGKDGIQTRPFPTGANNG